MKHEKLEGSLPARTARDVAFVYERHRLEALVDAFAAEMKKKLVYRIDENRIGAWADPAWETEDIIGQLKAHIEKGDPIDVANFTLFWWNRLPEYQEPKK